MDVSSFPYRLQHSPAMRCQTGSISSFGKVFRLKQDQAGLVCYEVKIAPDAQPPVGGKHDWYVISNTPRELVCLYADGKDDRIDEQKQDVSAMAEWQCLGRSRVLQEFCVCISYLFRCHV
nr:hypothetical protein [Paracoccus saliphilus]